MMIVTKDTNLKNMDISGVSIHSYNEAVDIYKKGNILAKIADEIRGSALAWVKKNEPEHYDEFLQVVGVKKDAANKLIAYSKLVEVAKELKEDYPETASKAAKLPGKKPEDKLTAYQEVKKEVGKEYPTQKEIDNYKKKLYEKDSNLSNIRKNYNEEIIDTEATPTDTIDWKAKYEAEKTKYEEEKAKRLKAEKRVKELNQKLKGKAVLKLGVEELYRYSLAIDSFAYELRKMLRVERLAKARRIFEETADLNRLLGKTHSDVDKALEVFGFKDGTFDLAAIKTRYRELVKQNHPDLERDPERKVWLEEIMADINKSYKTLKDYTDSLS